MALNIGLLYTVGYKKSPGHAVLLCINILIKNLSSSHNYCVYVIRKYHFRIKQIFKNYFFLSLILK